MISDRATQERVLNSRPFTPGAVNELFALEGRYTNWPIVYLLNSEHQVYVGETINGARRMSQHLKNTEKTSLTQMRFIVDETFNKSAALDLECQLIALFHADGEFAVLNKVEGIGNSEYFDRASYQSVFDQVFEELRKKHLLTRPVSELVNSELYKLSPFKSLNGFQAAAVDEMVPRIIRALSQGSEEEFVVRGGPGTGKTVMAIYMIKLLIDIARRSPDDAVEEGLRFSEHFATMNAGVLEGINVAFVVPQQSLRKTVHRVFQKTPGMQNVKVLSPYDLGNSEGIFDFVVVDEVHRLNVRANQSSAMLNKKFKEITEKIFGEDDFSKTQLDWIRKKSRVRLLMVDPRQTVRPMDLSDDILENLVSQAEARQSCFELSSQMRLESTDQYVENIRTMLQGKIPEDFTLGGYDFKLFERLEPMVREIRELNREKGLSLLVAGYAWDWVSKKNPEQYDIEEDGVKLRWNSTDKDWINSERAGEEVGSIHTVQGYDLNYAGVIIGPELFLDPRSGEVQVDLNRYRDKKAKERNNKILGSTKSVDEIRDYIINVYAVLMSRGIKGTYFYVCDEPLREHLKFVLEGADREDSPLGQVRLFGGDSRLGVRYGESVPATEADGRTGSTIGGRP